MGIELPSSCQENRAEEKSFERYRGIAQLVRAAKPRVPCGSDSYCPCQKTEKCSLQSKSGLGTPGRGINVKSCHPRL